MSAIIEQAKRKYKLALSIEFILILFVFFPLIVWKWNLAVSFLLGTMSIFIPHCCFVYLMFFTAKEHIPRLKNFYRGEIIKFLLTIILVIFAFKGFEKMHFVAFFTGYLSSILLTNLVPFLVGKYVKC